MSSPRAVLILAVVISLAVLPPASSAADVPKRPPNVVLLYADDLGYGDLSCYGAKAWKTPHLDNLAKQGVRLTDFYVAQAVCSASRAALLTGCYPQRVGIQGALGPKAKIGLSSREQTIASLLKAKGYATAIFGKWHLGHEPCFLPTRRGFDEYHGLPYSNDMWPSHPTAGKTFPPLPLMDGEKVAATQPDQTKLTGWATERAEAFVAKNKEKPFFLYVPYSMPHVPIFASKAFAGKSGAGLYGDVIAELDDSVGRILAALKKHGLEENTLVMFASDNGPWLSYGAHAGTTAGLREGKGTAFEGGVRVPCIVRLPGVVKAGTTLSEPLMTIDVLPTLVELCGAKTPGAKIDGGSFLPLLSGKGGAKNPHDALYFYYDRDLKAVRSGKWKLVFPHAYRTLAGKGGGEGGKPVGYAQAKISLSLFDLEADRAETTDVAAKHPEVVARLTKLADAMREDLGDTATKKAGTGLRAAGHVDREGR